MKIDGEQAFVLHTRAYRETSQLVDLFTRNHGRLRVVARGSRGTSRKGTGRALMPFAALQVSWSGKGELKTLSSAEAIEAYPLLKGERLYSGFYLNELLMRLLADHDPHEQLFDHYQQVVKLLAGDDCLETLLRCFETRLLEEIGYELVLDADVETGEEVRPDAWYWYDPQHGVIERFRKEGSPDKANWFKGEQLLAIAGQSFEQQETRKTAKRLLRLALQSHLGNKPLQSRKLFQAMEGAQ